MKEKQSANGQQATSSSARPPKQSKKSTPSWRLLRSAGKVTLDVFLDCLFDNDYSRLVVEGNPPEDEVLKAWNELYLEDLQLTQSKGYNETLEKTKEINVLTGRLVLVGNICNHLLVEYLPTLVQMLDELDLKPNISGKETPDELLKKINLVFVRSKKWNVQIEKKRVELAKDQAKESKPATRADFEDSLGALSTHFGFYVKETEISVARYRRGLNKMAEIINKIELKKHGRSKG